jgi:PAS domain S-box-containing protein
LSEEIIHRNGRFQQLLGWMRHSLQANAVLDSIGRVIFINHAAEELWGVRLFDVQGKNLCQIMHLNESETMRDCRERQISLEELRPHVIMEGFNHDSEHVSVLYFPYADDAGDVLMGVFILPLVLSRNSSDGRRYHPGW